jgi:hypothetical protein
MGIASVLIGIVLLFFGRRIFWLFVAGTGFAAGLFFARDYFQVESELLVLAIALLAGLIGALLALLLQKLAIGVAGFLAGGFLGATLFQAFDAEALAWIGFLLVGVFGAVLMLMVFDWALILLSSLIGAAFIVDALPVKETESFIVFAAAFVIGVVAQAIQFRKVAESTPSQPRKENVEK